MNTEKVNRCGCVILASGSATRFGSNKLLKSFRGEPMAARIMHIVAAADFSSAVVVTRWPEVANLARQNSLPVLLHARPYVSDTISLGTRYLTGTISGKPAPDGIMYCVADQPLLSADTVYRLIQQFKTDNESIIRLSGTDKKTGEIRFSNPVIFPASLFGELETLPPDEAGRTVIAAHRNMVRTVTVADDAELLDADTAEQFQLLEQSAVFPLNDTSPASI